MSMKLKESIINALQNLDVSKSTKKAKSEISDAVDLLKKTELNLQDTPHNQDQTARFFAYMFYRFPKLKTPKNKELMKKWTGIEEPTPENITRKSKVR